MTINPYAPTTEAIAGDPLRIALPEGVSSWTLIWTSIGYVSLSGAVFGLGLSLIVVALGSGLFGQDAVLLPLLGMVVGGAIAFFGALVIVPITYLALVHRRGGRLNGSLIRQYGFVSGFVTGFLTVLTISGFELYGALMALVPGLVGGAVTTLLMLPIAKRVNRMVIAQDKMLQEDSR